MTDVPVTTLTMPRGTLLRAALRSPSFMTGAAITLIFVVVALLSFVWTPYNYAAQDIPHKLRGMSLDHWFGTDQYGRDVFSQIIVGARTSIAVALIAVGVGVGIGTPLGLWAAAKRDTIFDELIMRGNDLVFAFPALLIAILITSVFGPSATNAIIAIGIFNIPVFARVARAGALAIWPREFILAARAAGKSSTQISIEHVLPNIATLLLVQGTIQFALGILAEAGLSYVGLGAQPPMPSWGRMLFDAQTRMVVAPWMAIFPGMAIVVTVLGLNLLGDGIADILDPKSRRQR
jgi:peptide/nickel transport system permease protein